MEAPAHPKRDDEKKKIGFCLSVPKSKIKVNNLLMVNDYDKGNLSEQVRIKSMRRTRSSLKYS